MCIGGLLDNTRRPLYLKGRRMNMGKDKSAENAQETGLSTDNTQESAQDTESTVTTKATPVVTTPDVTVMQQTEAIVIFKVTRPLMKHEYEELSARVRAENQASGLKIVLAPAIVDGVEISG
jgi:hypothetical protein